MVDINDANLFGGEEMAKDDDDDVKELESDSDYDSELVASALENKKKNAVYNEDGLLEKLEDVAWAKDVEWIHKLNIDIELPEGIDPHDDLARELAFYTQALDGTRSAFNKLQSMGIPFLRPPDYYAEMVKSDTHMLKVKGELLREKKKIEEAEERKKARESKKIAKEVQAQKNKERAKRKKEEFESVKKWRKQRQQSGFVRGEDEDVGFLDFGDERGGHSERPNKKRQRPGVAPGDRSGGFRKQGGKNKKRDKRDSKFGQGGRKGMKKQNTAETTDDLRGFNKGDMKRRKQTSTTKHKH